MEPLRSGQLRFRVHGPDAGSDEVPAATFAYQLAALVRALKAADKAANGGRRVHDYAIAKLQTSIPTAVLAERHVGREVPIFSTEKSGIEAFADCVSAILVGDRDRALAYGACARQVSRFGTSGYSEIWTGSDTVFRVDPFLSERAKSILVQAEEQLADAVPAHEWFKGAAHGTFDGDIKEVDLRGALPQIKLVMSAGGAQIDCVCRAEHVEDIRASLDMRVRVSGRAIYDGRSGLPRRIEVDEITAVDTSADFRVWKGAFEPFDYEAWEGDD